MIVRKILPKIKEFNAFLPRGFDVELEKMRKDSRKRLKNLGILH